MVIFCPIFDSEVFHLINFVEVRTEVEVTPECSKNFWKEESDEDEQELMKPLATSEGMAFALVTSDDERIKDHG